jgi:hypothetical protein
MKILAIIKYLLQETYKDMSNIGDKFVSSSHQVVKN